MTDIREPKSFARLMRGAGRRFILEALMRKYVESSMGQRTPFGIKQKEPSLKTAELRQA